MKSTVNYNRTVSHVFLESLAVVMLHSSLFLSCPAGTTTQSLLPPPTCHRCTLAHTHIDVCACAGLVWRSSAFTMPLYGCMTHRPACPTGMDFHSWSSLKHIFPFTSIVSYHVFSLTVPLLTFMYSIPMWIGNPYTCLHYMRCELVPFSHMGRK